jgi:hypothetical protein
MCMSKNSSATKKLTKKFIDRNKNEVVVWKVYRVVGEDKVFSPIYHNGSYIKPGWIVSDRLVNEYDGYNCIQHGIHVFLTREEARKYIHGEIYGGRVFKCSAQIGELVGVGIKPWNMENEFFSFKQAVFTKIHITTEELEKGKKGRN